MTALKAKFPYLNTKDQNEQNSTNLNCWRRLKKWVYLVLERPQTKIALSYHFFSLMLIFGSLVVSVLSTVESLQNSLEKSILTYEIFLLMWFTVEFLLRTWSCGYCSKFQGFRGRVRFICSFYMMIDVFVILSTAVTLIMQANGSYFTVLRVTRFMQVFRMLRVDRQRGDFRTMGKVVKEHSKELMTVYFVGFVIMFTSTYIVYICEKQQEFFFDGDCKSAEGHCANRTSGDEVMINNMANGLYWAVITVTSVGYGDLSPVTWTGKFFCAIFALVGCAFFSLPAGILGSGFALQVSKQKKEKRFVKIRHPAAYLIQTIWRNYAIRKSNSHLQGSWFYLLPQLKASAQELKELESLIRIEAMGESTSPDSNGGVHHTNGFMPFNSKNPIEDSITKVGKFLHPRRNSGADMRCTTIVLRKEHLLLLKYQSSKASDYSRRASGKEKRKVIADQLQRKYKVALRFIMKLRYWISIKLFKSVRHPFVNMQDIIEKNAVSHVEMLSQIKAMKDSFQILRGEIYELRMTLAGENSTGFSSEHFCNEFPMRKSSQKKHDHKLRRSLSLGYLLQY